MQKTEAREIVERYLPGSDQELRKLLDQLWADVAGERDVDDAHPRFYEHSSLMAAAGTIWPDLQDRIDNLRFDQVGEANSVERAAIRRITVRVLA